MVGIDDLCRDLRQVNLFVIRWLRLELRRGEQFVEDVIHLSGTAHQTSRIRGQLGLSLWVEVTLHHLGARMQLRQWRSQLVTGVRDESLLSVDGIAKGPDRMQRDDPADQ